MSVGAAVDPSSVPEPGDATNLVEGDDGSVVVVGSLSRETPRRDGAYSFDYRPVIWLRR